MIGALIGWTVFGLLVGAIARFLTPGEQPMGLLATMMLGVAGSFVGGLLGYLLTGGSLIQSSGWIGSILGALAVLAYLTYRQRRDTPSSEVR
jgi:uncharacterized membrane protein YeaQ/YmgE (transglycosylase-associated protein family)